MKNANISWLVFLIFGGLMWGLRYGGLIEGHNLALLIKYGPYAVLVLHVVLVLMAMQDAIFQGILCLLIPLYSFYWLFAVSDAFLLRAAVAGLFVGIGLDSAAFYQTVLTDVSNSVRAWIESGG